MKNNIILILIGMLSLVPLLTFADISSHRRSIIEFKNSTSGTDMVEFIAESTVFRPERYTSRKLKKSEKQIELIDIMPEGLPGHKSVFQANLFNEAGNPLRQENGPIQEDQRNEELIRNIKVYSGSAVKNYRLHIIWSWLTDVTQIITMELKD